uniref:SFRICE_020129 n=1 Tax=Spodoptera frugiperda TaxID=7108 RepID=A0A2H1V9Q7_SPOFR
MHARMDQLDRIRLPEAQLPSFPIFPIPDSPTTLKFLPPQKAGNAPVSPLVFQVSMGGGDCLPSANPSARLPAYTIKTCIY